MNDPLREAVHGSFRARAFAAHIHWYDLGMEMCFKLLVVSCIGGLLACNSAHQMSSPDTVPAGEYRLGVGAAVSQDPNVQGDLEDGASEVGGHLLLWIRHGVTDKTEVALMSFGLLSGAKVGVKHQVLRSRSTTGFALSMGSEVAAQVAPELGDYTRDVKRVDLWLPVHLGYRTDPSLALYLSPRYARRLLWAGDSDLISHNVAGAVFGVQLGTRVQTHLEFSAFRNLTDTGPDGPSDNEFGAAAGFSF